MLRRADSAASKRPWAMRRSTEPANLFSSRSASSCVFSASISASEESDACARAGISDERSDAHKISAQAISRHQKIRFKPASLVPQLRVYLNRQTPLHKALLL